MEEIIIGKHKICVELPIRGLKAKGNKAVLINDGEMVRDQQLKSELAILFGLIPNNRLYEYTPWKEKAIKKGVPDFGGGLRQYHQKLISEIIPQLDRKYHLDMFHLAYGGFSLGGLAAVTSLWHTKSFQFIFSICGSFWYPGYIDFMSECDIINKKARILLINGKKEGKAHGNLLESAALCAQQAHHYLSSRLDTVSMMDKYNHHDRKEERLQIAMNWLDKSFLENGS